jgi:hypothetical protein
MNRQNLCMLIAGGGTLLLLNGCAQVMAYNQAPPLDRSVLSVGADRAQVRAVLGAPTAKDELPAGEVTESYKYVDGGQRNGRLAKTGRIILYTAGDVFSAFLDQVLWIPAELLLKGTEYGAEVTYAKSGTRWLAVEVREFETADNTVVKEAVDETWRRQQNQEVAEVGAVGK